VISELTKNCVAAIIDIRQGIIKQTEGAKKRTPTRKMGTDKKKVVIILARALISELNKID
jgi:hypothetical protein